MERAVVVIMNFIKTCNWELYAYVAVFLPCILFVSFLSSSCAASGALRLSFGGRFALQGRSGRRLHCWLDGLVTRGRVDARHAPRPPAFMPMCNAAARGARPLHGRACFSRVLTCSWADLAGVAFLSSRRVRFGGHTPFWLTQHGCSKRSTSW
jgi:hypothetical protein